MTIKELLEDKVEASVIMGIDASTKSIAFSVFDESGLQDYGKIEIDGSCVNARESMESLISKWKPDLVAIESAVFVNNRSVVIKLAYIFGAIMSASHTPVKMVKPMQWLKFIGNDIRSNASTRGKYMKEKPGMSKAWYNNKVREERKEKTQEILGQEFGLKGLTDDDIADSIAVGWYAWNETNG